MTMRVIRATDVHGELFVERPACAATRDLEKPALSYMDFAPNHMESSFERLGLSTW
jgi:hypothetical protein